ncbi:MAG TPA: hypothetical protein VKB48_06120 [Candidatus Acidoferrum sp.]|nr:hypothetical protein [Candidatus Acidoferrum sp.]
MMVLACVFGGALLGIFLNSLLAEKQLGSDSRDVVRLTMGLVATTVAIVLGLLVASAKSYYDTQNSEVTQLAANFVLLDRVLAHYGQETADTRAALRVFLPRLAELFARLDSPGVQKGEGEVILDKIELLSPKDDNQRALKAQATNLAIQIGQIRWLIFEQKTIPVPRPLLLMLICWLTILFISFGLFGPRNLTVLVGLFISALAVSGAIFLILEMYHPDAGLLKVSEAPLRAAMAQLGR